MIEEHTKHLRIIFRALRNACLYANPKKCSLYQLEVSFLGHHISMRGIKVSMEKVDKILHWPDQNLQQKSGLSQDGEIHISLPPQTGRLDSHIDPSDNEERP
jgi:hypothetical protein